MLRLLCAVRAAILAIAVWLIVAINQFRSLAPPAAAGALLYPVVKHELYKFINIHAGIAHDLGVAIGITGDAVAPLVNLLISELRLYKLGHGSPLLPFLGFAEQFAHVHAEHGSDLGERFRAWCVVPREHPAHVRLVGLELSG